mmetsp:Transcript_3720/g.5441  ORF Transcript_3720/g.5441 Transcript_3720/m.5441 type:complete len:203 (-) Transcript_3720:444-1052(-)
MNNMKFSVIKKAAAMSSDSESVHALPESFTLTSRVLTDHNTGLSYFALLSSPSNLQILFLECGAVGSTTETIKIKHGTFHHFPLGADPSSFTTSPHAQLVVVLQPKSKKHTRNILFTLPKISTLASHEGSLCRIHHLDDLEKRYGGETGSIAMKAINDQFPDKKDISRLDAACSNSYLVPLNGHFHKKAIASLIEHGSFKKW